MPVRRHAKRLRGESVSDIIDLEPQHNKGEIRANHWLKADGVLMNAQPERADRELLGHEGPEGEFPPSIANPVSNPVVGQWRVEGIERDLTPLQYHYLSLLQRLIALKDSYQSDPDYEDWLMAAINKSIFSALRDSIEAKVGDEAKDLLNSEQRVE